MSCTMMFKSLRAPKKEVSMSFGIFTTAITGGVIFGFTAFQSALISQPLSPFTVENSGTIMSIGHDIALWCSVLSGPFLDHFGPRKTAIAGFSMLTVGFALLAFAVHLPTMVTTIAYGLVGLGGQHSLL